MSPLKRSKLFGSNFGLIDSGVGYFSAYWASVPKSSGIGKTGMIGFESRS